MRVIHQVHPEDFARYNTQQIRDKFLLNNLVQQDAIIQTYTHYDRMMCGVAFPVTKPIELVTYDQLKSEYFLERREVGIINIAGTGTVQVDGEKYTMNRLDCLYVGKGKKEVVFSSNNAEEPAKFVLISCPAHKEHPVQLMHPADATPTELGTAETANHRVINKYIHADGLKSCQLVMGLTNFKPGSLWNTMPAHTHDRRSEVYFYFNLPENQRVIHFMGEAEETRHMFVANEEAIVSPAWSIHSGVATASYSFIWAMAGENLSFTDMDFIDIKTLK
ncbi:5-dehydro-4-deoxy-D-glucuronate isomerase [Aridibaculum aurantiacum]|uniref:5-dehydro-4-deoxy-D-glucuronate isomerase n=1 Tax=Aridibaculum aurantiacum TaxID=2810307 RepID=UPI001A958BD6|nr:5-dehydro-4-deoxy-D-glucuronate isomerase [Aridibaculum aurantiacum]